ncbi:MAG: exostosin family protein [Polaromonas sp.]|nr:exostosin family protein [Polaromonas sp.]
MSEVQDSPNMVKQFLPERLNYAFWLKETDKLPVGAVSLLLNSDIYLDDSLDYLKKEASNILQGQMFIALTRYNPDGNGFKLNSNPHWTQDVWGVAKGAEPFHKALYQEAAFELGQPGCDNKIAYVMHSYGYTVTNPCFQLKSIHLQADTAREYDARASKLIGLHAFVHPTQSVVEAAKLEFDLLTRSKHDMTEIHFNNWINGRKSFHLRPQGAQPAPAVANVTLMPAPALTSVATQVHTPASSLVSVAKQPNPAVIAVPHPEISIRFEAVSKFSEKGLKVLFQYSNRYKVLQDSASFYYLDRFWPVVKIEAIADIAPNMRADKVQLFCRGYVPSNLLEGAFAVSDDFRHEEDYLFWQYPCITEKDAFEMHKRIGAMYVSGTCVHTYLGIPWATIVDRKSNAKSMMGVIGSRIKSASEVLKNFNLQLKTHTVCQHVHWKRIVPLFKQCEITDLAISHKQKGEDVFDGIALHPWTLYAVNYFDTKRRQGFEQKKIVDRKIRVSFEGAYMPHYISEVRKNLQQFEGREGFHIVLKNMWHFNKIVYNLQVKSDEKVREDKVEDEVLKYNRLMSDTVFSICPSGAGPNSLRLWECLANGSIPVLLSDRQELPRLNGLFADKSYRWEDVMVIHPEADLQSLPERLQQIMPAQLDAMQAAGQAVFNQVINITCYGAMVEPYERLAQALDSSIYASQAVLSEPTQCDEVVDVPAIEHQIVKLSLFKHQQVQCMGQTASVFSGEDTPSPAVMNFKQGAKDFLLWFNKTERVSVVYVTFEGKPFNLLVQGMSKLNKLVSLSTKFRFQKPSTFVYEISAEQIDLCLGLKLSTKDELETPVLATVTVDVFDNYYAQEFKRLDQVGLLKSVSDANSQRKDHFFDTEHIDSGKLLKQLLIQEEKFDTTNLELYPELSPRLNNLVSEDIKDGITMFVHLMNRNENVLKNLGNWLGQKVDELILLDWSSTQPVAELPGIFDDPRVRVVRVEGQTRFIRTLAQNLATQMARNKRVFKLDSDVEFKGDFFANHPLEKGYFWVGNWIQGRDFNERHLNGETYYHLDDFFRVNGYDERIVAYGQDDTNLKDRMVLAGLEMRVFSYNFLEHQHHDQALRSDNQTMIHPMVRTYQNRFLTNHNALWSAYHPSTQYTTLSKTDKHLVLEVAAQAQPIDVAAYENDAIELIASWYLPRDKLKEMNREAKVQKILELQVE